MWKFMLIGGDDISSDIITLGMCLQCLFTVVLISALRLLAKSDSSVDGSHRGIGGGIQITET